MQLVHPEADREGALEDTRIRQMHMLEGGSRSSNIFSCTLLDLQGLKF
jgi:hypothetical protein